MVNVGTYSTKETVKSIELFNQIDHIDSYLVVNGYYNKPTQTGLKKHFLAASEATERDILIYNIEGRTGINLETNTLVDILSESSNIV